MKYFLLSLLVVSIYPAYAQKEYDNDSIHLQLRFREGLVNDTGDMDLRLIYTNKLDRPVYVYKKFYAGNSSSIFDNIYIELEKFKDGSYSAFNLGIDHFRLPDPLNDSMRHFDFPVASLCPSCTVYIDFNLLNVSGFDSGSYRFKVWVRTSTIRNNTPYTDSTYATEFPLDAPVHFKSGWIYFRTTKRIIYPRRNPDTGEFEVARDDSSYF